MHNECTGMGGTCKHTSRDESVECKSPEHAQMLTLGFVSAVAHAAQAVLWVTLRVLDEEKRDL